MRYADFCCAVEELHDERGHIYRYSGPCVITKAIITVDIIGSELYAYLQGALIQDALVSNAADERDFLISGICGDAFDTLFEGDNE